MNFLVCSVLSARASAVAFRPYYPCQDEEEVKGIARVYAEIGEAYVDLIASGESDSATQLSQCKPSQALIPLG